MICLFISTCDMLRLHERGPMEGKAVCAVDAGTIDATQGGTQSWVTRAGIYTRRHGPLGPHIIGTPRGLVHLSLCMRAPHCLLQVYDDQQQKVVFFPCHFPAPRHMKNHIGSLHIVINVHSSQTDHTCIGYIWFN
jgi:hypothetical protein